MRVVVSPTMACMVFEFREVLRSFLSLRCEPPLQGDAGAGAREEREEDLEESEEEVLEMDMALTVRDESATASRCFTSRALSLACPLLVRFAPLCVRSGR